jgi:outer membrane receptor protein involved in Fe transport
MYDVFSTRLLRVAVIVLCFAGIAEAQTAATAAIEGLVTDATGAVLPGVTVTVRNMDTNLTREFVTDGTGRYRAAALQPGRYEVSATLGGFEARPIRNVEALVGRLAPVDVRMHVAGVEETITITEEITPVDTKRTDVSNVIDQNQIENLPLNGRRWDNFVLLGPGVTNDGSFGLVSYRGISGLYNNNMVDGVDNNQAFFSEARGRTRAIYSISESAIKEFQVGISNMSAEFGRSAGGTVNAVTKSGSNRMTGEGFYFLRDKSFQSQDLFIPDNVWNAIQERRQQFGVGVGGPIRRDKLFFFVDYDQQHRTNPPFVNTASATFYSGPCTVSAANCDATRAFYHSLEVASPREFNNKVGLVRVDWGISPSNTFSVTYNGQRWNAPNGVQTPALLNVANSANGTDIVKTDFSVVNLNTVVSRSWLNELRGQAGRDYEEQVPNAPGPSTSVTGGITFGLPNFLPRPAYPHEQRYEVLDNLTYYHGNHTLKAGTDINFIREQLINLFQGGGVYSYTTLNNIAADCPRGANGCVPVPSGSLTGLHYSSFTQAFDLNHLAGALYFPEWTYALFVQDSWRVNDNLLLNLGLRWDYQRLPEPGSVQTNGVTFAGNPALPLTTHFNQDKKDWAPRLGLTYDIGAKHTTVLRASYGIFYGLTSNSAVANALTNNGVNQATYFFTPSTAGTPAYPNVLSVPPTGATGNKPDINYFSSDLVRPRVHSVDVTVDRSVGSDVTVSASYLYSRGMDLPYFRDINLNPASSTVNYVLDGQGVGSFPLYRGGRPNTSFNRIVIMEPAVKSKYNALVLAVNRRFSRGLLFNANYTLSKSEDNGQSSATFFGSNLAYDALNFRSASDPVDSTMWPSNNDRRHRFVASFHYRPDVLWGIGIGGVLTLESGLPLTEKINGSLAPSVGAVNSASTNGTGGVFDAPWVGVNTDRQTGRKTFDIRVSKEVRLAGTSRLQVLWEVFNLFNTVNYSGFFDTAFNVTSSSYNPAANVATVDMTRDSGYLVPRSDVTNFWGPRDMQLGIKFLW